MRTRSKMKPRVNNPILSKNRQRPIGTYQQANQIKRIVKQKVSYIMSNVVKRIKEAPTVMANSDDLGSDGSSVLSLLMFISSLIRTSLDDGQIKEVFKQSYRLGLTTAITSVENQLSSLLDDSVFVIDGDIEHYLQKRYNEIDPLWGVILDDVIDKSVARIRGVLTSGVRGGKSPDEIGNDVLDVKDKILSMVFYAAVDEVNNSARLARLESLSLIDDKIAWVNKIHDSNEYGSSLVWESALLPVTRPWHAALHGKMVTTAFIKEFYSENGNWRNCYCSQHPVVTVNGQLPESLTQHFSMELHQFRQRQKNK